MLPISFRLAPCKGGRSFLALLVISFIALTVLAGCGGGSGEGTAKIPNQAAERNVAVADLPSLSDCLSQIDAALLKDPRQRTVGLFCLQGTLRGLTADGSACALKIDADTGVFRFDFGRQSVSLKWQDIVFPPNGPAIHNLENAGTPAQPGVRLTQFTGGSKPVTEAIMLRAGVRGGSGPSAMPTISYQYTQNDQPSLVECRFGK